MVLTLEMSEEWKTEIDRCTKPIFVTLKRFVVFRISIKNRSLNLVFTLTFRRGIKNISGIFDSTCLFIAYCKFKCSNFLLHLLI